MYEITWILFDIYFTLALFCPMILHIKEKIFENFYDEVSFDTMLRMCEVQVIWVYYKKRIRETAQTANKEQLKKFLKQEIIDLNKIRARWPKWNLEEQQYAGITTAWSFSLHNIKHYIYCSRSSNIIMVGIGCL